MKQISSEEHRLWLLANRETKRLKKQDVINPVLEKAIKVQPALSKQYCFQPFPSIPPKQIKKSMNTGTFRSDATLDLHGYSLQQAHDHLHVFIKSCFDNSRQQILIITGHGNGSSTIKREFGFWVRESEMKQYIHSVTQAHPRQGGDGAYYVILKRKKI